MWRLLFVFALIALLFLKDSASQIRQAGQPVTIQDVLDTFGFGSANQSSTDWNKMDCQQAISRLIKDLPDKGSIFYVLENGIFLNQWEDWESCLLSANQAQFVRVEMKGNYTGQAQFTRGGVGKFHNFSTFMGICIPRQCTQQDLVEYATDHFTAMAHLA